MNFLDFGKTPSQALNKPVIGSIRTELTITDLKTKAPTTFNDQFEVIAKEKGPNGNEVYVCNQWNSVGVIQLVPADCVKKFTPLKKPVIK